MKVFTGTQPSWDTGLQMYGPPFLVNTYTCFKEKNIQHFSNQLHCIHCNLNKGNKCRSSSLNGYNAECASLFAVNKIKNYFYLGIEMAAVVTCHLICSGQGPFFRDVPCAAVWHDYVEKKESIGGIAPKCWMAQTMKHYKYCIATRRHICFRWCVQHTFWQWYSLLTIEM